MGNKGMCNADRLHGAIKSIISDVDLQNGMIIALGALKAGERELYEVVKPTTANIKTDEFLLHYSPEVMYETGKQISDFELKAGRPGRVYHLVVGDEFTITDNMITGASKVGEYLIPQNGSFQLAAAANLEGETTLVCKVIEKGVLGFNNNAATTVRVIKNIA